MYENHVNKPLRARRCKPLNRIKIKKIIKKCTVYYKYDVIFIFLLGDQMVICAAINTAVHTVMYSYYFLSAMGPQMQKYLWWKKYLTRMQIVSKNKILSIFLYYNEHRRIDNRAMLIIIDLFRFNF